MKTFGKIIIPAAAAMILGVWGCQQDDIIRWRDASLDPEFARLVREAKIRESQVALFADLSDYDQSGLTKRNDNDRLLQLAGLLDMNDVREESWDGCRWRQTAFLQNRERVLAMIDDSIDDGSRATTIKKYLIETCDGDGNSDIFVAAMVTDSQYAQDRNLDSYDFLDKTNFDGAILFSEIDGTLREVRYYRRGMIIDAEALRRGQALPEDGQIMCIAVAEERNGGAEESAPATRAGQTLGPSYCTAYYSLKTPVYVYVPIMDGWITDPSDAADMMVIPNMTESDKVGARAGSSTKDTKKKTVEPTCTVRLMVDNPRYGKITSGSGTFSKGSTITVATEPASMLYTEEYRFQYWSGAFKGAGPKFVCKVTQDLSAMAHWGERPCVDSTRALGNPLRDMKIASTQSYQGNDGNVNYWGGVFGTDNRVGVDDNGQLYKKGHQGIDLEAPYGAEAYAMHDGRITRIVRYPGPVKDGYGNIIEYTCEINGKSVMFRYAHLKEGAPVATNPYTGEEYREGDFVAVGDVLGYAGRTGNAWNVPNLHLHLEVHVNGVPVDPRDWVNATYGNNMTELNAAKGAVKSKRCDNKK